MSNASKFAKMMLSDWQELSLSTWDGKRNTLAVYACEYNRATAKPKDKTMIVITKIEKSWCVEDEDRSELLRTPLAVLDLTIDSADVDTSYGVLRLSADQFRIV